MNASTLSSRSFRSLKLNEKPLRAVRNSFCKARNSPLSSGRGVQPLNTKSSVMQSAARAMSPDCNAVMNSFTISVLLKCRFSLYGPDMIQKWKVSIYYVQGGDDGYVEERKEPGGLRLPSSFWSDLRPTESKSRGFLAASIRSNPWGFPRSPPEILRCAQDDKTPACHPERSEGSLARICPADLPHVALRT